MLFNQVSGDFVAQVEIVDSAGSGARERLAQPDFVPVCNRGNRMTSPDGGRSEKGNGLSWNAHRRPHRIRQLPLLYLRTRADGEHWEEMPGSPVERREREPDARTVEPVRIGEPQPEIDHNLSFEQSGNGTGPEGGRRHANAGGWFGYELKLPPAGASAVPHALDRGPDGGREINIQLDGVLAAAGTSPGGREGCDAVEHPLPGPALAGKGKVTVRFQPRPGSTAGGIFDVRLLKAKRDPLPAVLVP